MGDDDGNGSFGGGSEATNDSDLAAGDDGAESEEPVETNDDGTTPDTDDGSDEAGNETAGTEITNLTIQKWNCEEAIDAGASYDDLILACGPSLETSTWQLNQIPIDSETGLVIWNIPGSGGLIVSVDTSACDSESAVYCNWFVNE